MRVLKLSTIEDHMKYLRGQETQFRRFDNSLQGQYQLFHQELKHQLPIHLQWGLQDYRHAWESN